MWPPLGMASASFCTDLRWFGMPLHASFACYSPLLWSSWGWRVEAHWQAETLFGHSRYNSCLLKRISRSELGLDLSRQPFGTENFSYQSSCSWNGAAALLPWYWRRGPDSYTYPSLALARVCTYLCWLSIALRRQSHWLSVDDKLSDLSSSWDYYFFVDFHHFCPFSMQWAFLRDALISSCRVARQLANVHWRMWVHLERLLACSPLSCTAKMDAGFAHLDFVATTWCLAHASWRWRLSWIATERMGHR